MKVSKSRLPGARPSQHHDEEPERAGATSRNRDLPDVSPVDLRLLADEWVEAQKGFAVWRWAHHRDEATQGALAAEIAAISEHVEKSRRAQAWVFQ